MEKQRRYRIAGAFFLPWAILLILLRTVDLQPIGPGGTKVGLAKLNGAVALQLGYRAGWYRLTTWLGVLALAAAVAFGVLALVQMIRRRSLPAVDRKLRLLAGLYGALLGFYVLFEVLVVNRRPVLLPGETTPAASFPAPHAMLACTVWGSAILLVGDYFRSERLCFWLRVACGALMVLTVCGRMLSGVYWITDVLGGYLLSGMLLALYSAWIQP